MRAALRTFLALVALSALVGAAFAVRFAAGKFRQHQAAAAPPAALTPAPPARHERVFIEAYWRERDEDPAPLPTVEVPKTALPPAIPVVGPFDTRAAKVALGGGLESLPVCRAQGAEGAGMVEVIWTPDGRVTRVNVSDPFGDSPAGACIARRFMSARIPPFAGGAMAMRVSFRI